MDLALRHGDVERDDLGRRAVLECARDRLRHLGELLTDELGVDATDLLAGLELDAARSQRVQRGREIGRGPELRDDVLGELERLELTAEPTCGIRARERARHGLDEPGPDPRRRCEPGAHEAIDAVGILGPRREHGLLDERDQPVGGELTDREQLRRRVVRRRGQRAARDVSEQRAHELGPQRFARDAAFRPRREQLPAELVDRSRRGLAGKDARAPREHVEIMGARHELPAAGRDREGRGVAVRKHRAHVVRTIRHRLDEVLPRSPRGRHRRREHVLERDTEQRMVRLLRVDLARPDRRGERRDLALQPRDPRRLGRVVGVGHDRHEVRVHLGVGEPDVEQVTIEERGVLGERRHHAAHERGDHEAREQIDRAG